MRANLLYPPSMRELHPVAVQARLLDQGLADTLDDAADTGWTVPAADAGLNAAVLAEAIHPSLSTMAQAADDEVVLDVEDDGNEEETWDDYDDYSPEEHQAHNDRFQREENALAALDAAPDRWPVAAVQEPAPASAGMQRRAGPIGTHPDLLEGIRTFKAHSTLRRVEKNLSSRIGASAAPDTASLLSEGAQHLITRYQLHVHELQQVQVDQAMFPPRSDDEWEA
ncbi:hypothetical protein [Stenotrophomonas sp. NPDC077659]|uniref:hypothetical protein n=1 Tax=Stenotrophomonas sp. NPDC077659 TaxID=3390694 RepID=UPI003D00E731